MLLVRSDEELETLRAKIVKWVNDYDRGIDGPKLVFSCDGCNCRNLCEHAYEPYNIGGECAERR